MFNSKEVPKYKRMLESELDRALVSLRTETVGNEDYGKTLSIVEKLHDMQDNEKAEVVSKNTLLTVGANLLGIILILKHEHLNPITSKALSFVIRPR